VHCGAVEVSLPPVSNPARRTGDYLIPRSYAPEISSRIASRWRFQWPGPDGEKVVMDATRRLAAAVREWSLAGLTPMSESYWGATFAARSHGREVVLKVNPRAPDGRSPHSPEVKALRLWSTGGVAPEILDSRDGGATYMMRRCLPGTMLMDAERDPLRIVEILGGTCRDAHRLDSFESGTFTDLAGSDEAAKWSAALRGTREATTLHELLAPRSDDVLLHLDLHCANVLWAGDRWQIIDPIPHLGDPNADIYALIFNPSFLHGMPENKRAATAFVHRHLLAYARSAGLDLDRAVAWLRVRSVYRLWRAEREQDAADMTWTSKLGRMVELLPDA
jgi:Aminoglycoside/hydroxyurea antibiotic resistance kinase